MGVSVIIPTYNRAHLLTRAIASIQQQTYLNWQLIIVDDGSTDNTEEIVKPFLLDPRIQYFYKENSGASESRNFGVSKSSEPLITFLDSDDEAYSNWLQVLIDKIEGGNYGCVFCGLEVYDHQGKRTTEKRPTPKGPLYQKITCRFTNSGIFLLYKNFFEMAGGYDISLPSGQHTELGIRLMKLFVSEGIRTTYVNDLLIRINIHTGPRIRTDNKAKYEGAKKLFYKHKDLILKDSKNRRDLLRILLLQSWLRKDYSNFIIFFTYNLRYNLFS